MKITFSGTDWQKDVTDAVFQNKFPRFISLMAGRRAGKSYESATLLVAMAVSKAKSVAWYIVPNYSQAMEQYERIIAYPELESFIKRFGQKPYPHIKWRNGSVTAFRSFEKPRGLRGSGVDLVIVDEIQDINPKSFWPVIRPLISDRQGKLMIAGQHRGLQSWYYKELFVHGLKDSPSYDPLYKAYQIHSKDGLVFQTPEGKEELALVEKQMLKAIFDQEYACVPSANQASIFRYDDLEAITQGEYVTKPASMTAGYVVGYDLGRIVDPSAAVVIDEFGHVCYEEVRPLNEKHEVGAKQAARISRVFNNSTLIIDATGGAQGGKVGASRDEYVKYYRTECPNMSAFYFTETSKKRAIEALGLAVEQRKITISPGCKVLREQLEQYEYKIKPSGYIEYSAPPGCHDDCLKKGTLIKTIEGYVPIEEINPGDLVLTHTGSWKPVEICLEKDFAGKWYDLKFNGMLNLELSYNHPIYVSSPSYVKDKKVNYTYRKFVLPEELNKGMTQVSRRVVLEDNKNLVIKDTDLYQHSSMTNNIRLREIILDSSFAKFLGLFLADGCACSTSKNNSLSIAFNRDEQDELQEMADYLSTLGVAWRKFSAKSHCDMLEFSSKLLWNLLRQCYNSEGEKVLPKYAMSLGKDLKLVLDGWLQGDSSNVRNRVIGVTTSKQLALSMRDIVFDTGGYAILHKVTRHRYTKKTKDQYWVEIGPENQTCKIKRISEGETGSKLHKSIVTEYAGKVYNLQVAEDRSFVADGHVVHNCVLALAMAYDGLKRGMCYKLSTEALNNLNNLIGG